MLFGLEDPAVVAVFPPEVVLELGSYGVNENLDEVLLGEKDFFCCFIEQFEGDFVFDSFCFFVEEEI